MKTPSVHDLFKAVSWSARTKPLAYYSVSVLTLGSGPAGSGTGTGTVRANVELGAGSKVKCQACFAGARAQNGAGQAAQMVERGALCAARARPLPFGYPSRPPAGMVVGC